MDNESDNFESLAFHCAISRDGCGARFKSTMYRTEPHLDRAWLPVRYFAVCPKCGEEAGQAGWQLAQWKAIHDNGSTGPSTAEGRLRISEANKARDAGSYEASRFNALTHGLSAEVARFFPARPGKYAQCDNCDYLTDGCGTQLRHCAKRTELFVQFHLAQQEGDGRLLGRLMASNQAAIAAIQADMIRSIAIRGVDIETPVYYADKDSGKIKLATYLDEAGNSRTITKVEAHPLLRILIDFIAKNNTSLGDIGLTPKPKEEQARFKGNLDDDDRETAAWAQQRMAEQVAKLREIMGGGRPVIGRVVDADVVGGNDA